jgi:hypothetical protein
VVAVPVAVTARHHADQRTPTASNPLPSSWHGAVAWKPLAAAPTSPRSDPAANAPACAPRNLKLTMLPDVNPVMGVDYINVDVTNTGSTGCALHDSDLNGLHWGDHHAKPLGPDKVTLIAAGKTQRYELGFNQQCQASDAPATATTTVQATLAGKKLALGGPGIPSAFSGCDATTSTIPSAADDPDTTSPYAALRATLDVTKNVVAGQLRYTITITNGGPRPLIFTTCPNYTQTLAFAGADPLNETFQLNCDPADPIAPGASRTYAMEIDVPTDAIDDGPIKLAWMTDEGPDAGVLLNADSTTH